MLRKSNIYKKKPKIIMKRGMDGQEHAGGTYTENDIRIIKECKKKMSIQTYSELSSKEDQKEDAKSW